MVGTGAAKCVALLCLVALHAARAADTTAVRTWGLSRAGQLGRPGLAFQHPGAVDASLAATADRLVIVDSGAFFSMALSAQGELLTWGDNGAGALMRPSSEDLPLPGAVDSQLLGAAANHTLVDVSAGFDSALLLSASGRVFRAGRRDDCFSCTEFGCVGELLAESCGLGLDQFPDILTLLDTCDATCLAAVEHALDVMNVDTAAELEADPSVLAGYVADFKTACAVPDYADYEGCDQTAAELDVSALGAPVVQVSAGVVSDVLLSAAGQVWQYTHAAPPTAVDVDDFFATEVVACGELQFPEFDECCVDEVAATADCFVSGGGDVSACCAEIAAAYNCTQTLCPELGDDEDLDIGALCTLCEECTAPDAGELPGLDAVEDQALGSLAQIDLSGWLQPGEAVLSVHSSQYRYAHMALSSFGPASAGERVVKLSVGANVAAAVTNAGRVFTWAASDALAGLWCDLGRDQDDWAQPRVVDSLAEANVTVADVAVGYGVAVAVADDGRVFSWGDESAVGRVDTTYVNGQVVKLLDVDGGDSIAAATAGAFHATVVSRVGGVYSWASLLKPALDAAAASGEPDWVGRARYTQTPGDVDLGIDETVDGIVVEVVTADDGTMFALTSTGAVLSWGSGAGGTLGRSGDATLPGRVDFDVRGDRVVQIAATQWLTLAFTELGALWLWGMNDAFSEPVELVGAGVLEPGSGFAPMPMFQFDYESLDFQWNVVFFTESYVQWLPLRLEGAWNPVVDEAVELTALVPVDAAAGEGFADVAVGVFEATEASPINTPLVLVLTTHGRVFKREGDLDGGQYELVATDMVGVSAGYLRASCTSAAGGVLTWGYSANILNSLGRDAGDDYTEPGWVDFAEEEFVSAQIPFENAAGHLASGRMVTWGSTKNGALARDTGSAFLAAPDYADDFFSAADGEMLVQFSLATSQAVGIALVSVAPSATAVSPESAPTDWYGFNGTVQVKAAGLKRNGEAAYCRFAWTAGEVEVPATLWADSAGVNCSAPYVGSEGDVVVQVRFDAPQQPLLDAAALYGPAGAGVAFEYEGCAAGKDKSASSTCEDCVVGAYKAVGDASCSACPAGMDTAGLTGATDVGACVCTDGFATTSAGACECPPGSALSADGESCSACPAGTYQPDVDGAACLACPDNAASGEGAADCACVAGYFGVGVQSALECFACDEGLECNVNGLTFATVESEPGFWQDKAFFVDAPGELYVHECFDEGPCLGMGNCSTGHTGPMCGTCEAGFTRSGGECVECGESLSGGAVAGLVVAALVGAVCAAFVVVKFKKAVIAAKELVMGEVLDDALEVEFTDDPDVDTGGIKGKIIVGFFQVLSSFETVFASVAWPAAFTDLTSRLNALNFDLASLPGVGCVVETTHYDRLLFVTVAPLAIIAGLALLALAFRELRVKGHFASLPVFQPTPVEEAVAVLREALQPADVSGNVGAAELLRLCAALGVEGVEGREGAYQLMFAMQLGHEEGEIEAAALRQWCSEEPSEQARRWQRAQWVIHHVESLAFKLGFFVLFLMYPGVSTVVLQTFRCVELEDGSSYLIADLAQSCDAGSAHASWSAYAGVMTAVYPVGVPLFFFWALYRVRDDLFLSKGLRAAGSGLPCEPNPEQAARVGFLYLAYEPQFWWWECVELLRKLCITAVILFIMEGSASQIVVAIVISLAAMVLYAYMQPFVEGSDDTLMLVAQMQTLLTLIYGLLLFVDVSQEDRYNGGLFGDLLVFVNVAPIAMFVAVMASEQLGAALEALEGVKEKLGLAEEASVVEVVRALRSRSRSRAGGSGCGSGGGGGGGSSGAKVVETAL